MENMSMMVMPEPEIQIVVCPPDVVQVPPPWLQEIIDMLSMFGLGGFFGGF